MPARPGSAGQASAGQAGTRGGQRGRPHPGTASQAATNLRAPPSGVTVGTKVKFHTGDPGPELCPEYVCLAQSGSDVILAQWPTGIPRGEVSSHCGAS